MAIPTYDRLMLPLLKYLNDGSIRSIRDCEAWLAEQVGVTERERQELLPSGRQSVWVSRVGWAATYLVNAGVLRRPRRAHLQTTERSSEVLADAPKQIDQVYLSRFPEFVEFQHRSRSKSKEATKPTPPAPNTEPIVPVGVNDRTPEEMVAEGFQRYQASLADDLLERILSVSPSFFERLVVRLLVAMGYGGSFDDAAQVVGKTGDGGIDGTIKEDRLGLDTIYVQAKRWQGTVGQSTVAEFVGNLARFHADKGVLITTSAFSQPARTYVTHVQQRIVLVDGRELAELMLEHGVGASPTQTYVLQRIDNDFFDEGDVL